MFILKLEPFSNPKTIAEFKNALVFKNLKSKFELSESEKRVLKAEKGQVEAEKKMLRLLLTQANAEVLRMKGLFSVRGMLEYIEDKYREEFMNARKGIKYTRKDMYIYLATTHPGLTKMEPQKYGSHMTNVFKNYSGEIHDGKRSAMEVSDAGDSILIRESLLVDYEQVQCLIEFAEYFKYPYEVKLLSRNE